jgi:cysteine synthase A
MNRLTGNTPLVKISSMLYAKFECYNPTGSIKDRIIEYITSRAKSRGELLSGMTLIEATSGNTGIALAAYGAVHGHPVKIVMPENMSKERRLMLEAYGAEIINVEKSDFTGAIQLRDELVKKHAYWTPNQFKNPLNIECHKLITGPEILNNLRDLAKWIPWKWGAFVSGAGTGGTMMGIHEFLSGPAYPHNVKRILAIPAEPATKHGIQGINDGADFLLDKNLMDEIIEVSTADAKQRVATLACESGLFVGISSGANIVASEKWLAANPAGGIVVTILCDRGERYMSVP